MPTIPILEPYNDVRVLADHLKVMTGNKKLTPEALSALAGNGSTPVPTEIVSLLSRIKEIGALTRAK
jgi:hypothetical protein